MPTVAELSAPYGNFMLSPRPGAGVCATCFNFTKGVRCCYACAHCEQWLDAFAPVSYSVAHEQLHHALAAYKRVNGDVGRRLTLELAAVLWRFLDAHERCLAAAAGLRQGAERRSTPAFDIATTVPSGDRYRDDRHALRRIVAELIAPTRSRYERLLTRSPQPAPLHEFDGRRYETTQTLTGEAVLLIDDTWTTGANAQSAAAALKAAGAGPVAAAVIGRHLNRDWHENDRRIRALARPFDWDVCALCAPRPGDRAHETQHTQPPRTRQDSTQPLRARNTPRSRLRTRVPPPSSQKQPNDDA